MGHTSSGNPWSHCVANLRKPIGLQFTVTVKGDLIRWLTNHQLAIHSDASLGSIVCIFQVKGIVDDSNNIFNEHEPENTKEK